MEGVRDVREIKPERGDLILILNNSPEKISVIGRFGEYLKKGLGLLEGSYNYALSQDLFSMERGLVLRPLYLGVIPIPDPIDQKISFTMGSSYPIKTDQQENSNEIHYMALFYKGEESILNALESLSHTFPYLPTARLFIDSVRDERENIIY